MALDICCICLDSTKKLKKLSSQNEHKIKLITKLKNVAPEQNWLENFTVCEKCNVQLDNAYNFKILCLKNDLLRKKLSQQCELASDCSYPESNLQLESLCVNDDDVFNNSIEDEDTSDTNNKALKDSKMKSKFICFHCNRSFTAKLILEKHLSQQHSNTCGQCPEIFITKKDLKIHMKNNHSDVNTKSTKFQCEVCGEYFSLLKNILKHCSIMHSIKPKDVKPYWCTQCKSKFNSSTLLIQHIKYHDGNRTFICSTCGKSFITKRDLSGHEKLHDNQRKYDCDKCDKSFRTSQNLKTHIYVVHTDPSMWKYACPVCLKRFAMKANFNEHLKRHQGNKDYSCHICKKMFVSNHEVKKHVKLHSNIALYKCSQCQKNYRDKRSLDLHLSKTHSIGIVKLPVRVKKFVCHVCPSQFFDNHKLQRHIRAHTGVKPYACHGCDKRFVDKSYLSHHLKSVHNIRNSVEVKQYSNFSENV